ncbi:MAG TPA: glycoside hydrolase [Leeuwenhoekiella sp.]|nr:glycoside hydrolase [Leeuwenhoekiella sp.]
MRFYVVRCIFPLFLIFSACQAQEVSITKKIDGVSYVASRDAVEDNHLQPLLDLGVNYASVMPFAFMRSMEQPQLHFNGERQWYGETYAGAGDFIKLLHTKNIKVMLKPHIWIGRGTFTGDMLLDSEENWQQLEADFERYILLYAKLAEENDVEIYCIGTELFNFVKARTAFWTQLITKVRKIYKGQLTYAENWDKVEENPLWDDLDYIGADAYFPVSDAKTPAISEARTGWKPHKIMLRGLSKKFKKPVLFTEYGYRSVDFSGRQPWLTDRTEGGVNMQGQLNLTEALFDEFWDEPWFAGGFIWKWHHDHESSGGAKNNRFTPQNKPVQEFLKKRFNLKKK